MSSASRSAIGTRAWKGPRVAAAAVALAALSALQPTSLPAARSHGGIHIEAEMRNVLANCERHDWARRERDEAVERARLWVEQSDETLWRLVPGQELPRCIDVTFDTRAKGPRIGCLQCGGRILRHGSYPYTPDIRNKPWKLTCPGCSAVFPTNDFGRYYESGLDERGLFDPEKADRSLLFNTAHPDPADPLHRFGVDDGFGYVDARGHTHKFIGYYGWKLWREIVSGVRRLSTAYLYTGDKVYARKAAILLDRIADVYPDMDWAPYSRRGWFHSDGHTGRGKIEGSIWEAASVLPVLAESYDRILSGTVDNPELYAFLASRAERYRLPRPKGTRDLFLANVDDNLLRCGAQAIRDRRVWGNEGMQQSAMALCALALDTEPETSRWLDWIFEPEGGNLPGLILGKISNDGVGPEAGPEYVFYWGLNLSKVADLIDDYPKYTRHSVYRDFPQFRNIFTAGHRMAALGFAVPNFGDSGSTGHIGVMSAARAPFIARGFRRYRDPEMARAAWEANGGSAGGLSRNVFDADPGALAREMERLASAAAARPAPSGHMAGYGMARLQTGRGRDGQALVCYYGRNGGHGHYDQLNFDLLAFGRWMAPDLGYPEIASLTSRSRWEWNNHTLSHNLVLVDGERQRENWSGLARYFHDGPGFGAFEIDARAAYPQTREYSRAMMAVKTPGEGMYVVDLFRVRGGRDHLLSFHGPPGAVTADGVHLVRQTTGTYAGESIPFYAMPDGSDTGTTFPAGYSTLDNVERAAAPPARFTLDWKAETGWRGITDTDDLHLRWHVLTGADDLALADGDPAQNREGNPRRIRYALLHRAGSGDLASDFLSVLEPWSGAPRLRSVERLPIRGASPHDGRAALRVTHEDGTVDYVFASSSQEPFEVETGTEAEIGTRTGTGPGKRGADQGARAGEVAATGTIRFAGSAGFVRLCGGRVTSATLVHGTELSVGETRLVSRPAWTGSVARMTLDPREPAAIWTAAGLPLDGSLAGAEIVVAGEGGRNACYRIEEVTKEGDLTRISCGRISFARGFKDPGDYSKGCVYDFREGAPFRIPVVTSLPPCPSPMRPQE